MPRIRNTFFPWLCTFGRITIPFPFLINCYDFSCLVSRNHLCMNVPSPKLYMYLFYVSQISKLLFWAHLYNPTAGLYASLSFCPSVLIRVYWRIVMLGLFHLKGYGGGWQEKKYILQEGGSEPKVCKEGVVWKRKCNLTLAVSPPCDLHIWCAFSYTGPARGQFRTY